ncbi:hypothetical protein SAMN05216417_12922 [Nitrosospira multiformis]|uniref:Uncharacterized protein n=1 Tax=Nitrosospira multiformis TaxID=1231 RepID=A0A1I7IWW6_9PROT|nr:hypothetical protein SAMN05216417_12922 [Nitrosospira multiformis]
MTDRQGFVRPYPLSSKIANSPDLLRYLMRDYGERGCNPERNGSQKGSSDYHAIYKVVKSVSNQDESGRALVHLAVVLMTV